MPEQDLPPLRPSPQSWLDAVTGDFPAFLRDHVSCEKKASGMALNIASHYPNKPVLLRVMCDLAVEELSHWRETMKILLDYGIEPAPDQRDTYVNALQHLIRRGPSLYLLDRLLVAALLERRGAERFARIGESLAAGTSRFAALAPFYRALAASEARHCGVFIELAGVEFSAAAVTCRLHELHAAEESIMLSLPPAARLH
ncbi:MAG: tRNA-(ms[2]io[6]A)-hydroxylase [Gammaproteobacteria bacterium]|nr:tRNA-(ms[2]io[6]A)-hydroxylase [Gammaproteobacteria bacterium]